MDETRKQEFLVDFSKHVPEVLIQQLIATQAFKYVNCESPGTLIADGDKKSGKNESKVGLLVPSLQRFYGAILFVDISGFTLLSQKLDVESLKNHINGYFSRILEIVEKWGGDVVKFAGDAIYVIWPTTVDATMSINRQPSQPMFYDGRPHIGRSNSSQGSKRSNNKTQPNTVRSSCYAALGNRHSAVKQSASIVVDQAIKCGMEIIEQCGELPVFLDLNVEHKKSSAKHYGRLSSFVSNITNKILARNAPISPDQQSDSIAYLNIHAGVGVGLMAGIDIGWGDRWEYFLVGNPMADVALAESLAEKGDIVVSVSAHELFHPSSNHEEVSNTQLHHSAHDKSTISPRGLRLHCGCIKLTEECILVQRILATGDEASVPSDPNNSHHSLPSIAMREKAKSKVLTNGRSSANIQSMTENLALHESICSEIRSSMSFVTPKMREAYTHAIIDHCKKNSCNDDELTKKEDYAFNIKMLEKRLPAFLQGKVRPHFFACIERSLIDQLIGHIHDVVRPDDYNLLPRYSTSEETFCNVIRRFLSEEKMRSRQPTVDKYAFAKILQAVDDNVSQSNSKIEIGNVSRDELDEPLALEPVYKDAGTPIIGETNHAHNIEAELRTVTVMFIKIDSFDMSLLIDNSAMKDSKRSFSPNQDTGFNPIFRFLDRTENEHMADQLILRRLQRCMEVLHRAIYDHGGQMRQFMIDDKGTVCIASFGLRGSVNEDNAANALEAANAIIHGLQEESLGSSIGVTTGKVYCGLVGSTMRHEFALMGPSVNLSARLMCKATLGSILCDHETMQRDRSHDFKHVGDIIAKGYEHPVPTYRPSFGHSHHGHMQGMPYLIDRQGSNLQNGSNSSAPFAKRFSSLRFSVAMDPHQFRSLTTFLRTKNVPGVEKLQIIISSDFFVTDESHAALFELLASRSRGSFGQGKNVSYTGCRPMRGRKKEIEKSLKFLFSEFPADDGLISLDCLPRLFIVVASGGIGKTAFLSALGRKFYSTAKQDAKCNVAVLRNRSSSLTGNIRLNPWKPILLEVLRLINRTMIMNRRTNSQKATEVSSHSSQGRSIHRRRNSSISMVLNDEDIDDYIAVADFVFTQLSPKMAVHRGLVMHLLGYLSEDEIDIPSSATSQNESRSKDVETIFLAIFQFCVSFTKKALIIIIEDIQSIDIASRELLRGLWRNGRGLLFMVSLLMEAEVAGRGNMMTSDLPSEEASTEDAAKRTSAIGSLTQFLMSNSSAYPEINERLLALELNILDKEATAEIVHDIIDGSQLMNENHLSYQQKTELKRRIGEVVSESGGHPLYAVQLAKNLVLEEEVIAASSSNIATPSPSSLPNTNNKGMSSALRMEVLHMSNMQRRVEEIICFRLDRLDAAAQIILKAATVCASHGRGFSADLIAFLLRHCSRLNAAVMTTLLSEYREEDFLHGEDVYVNPESVHSTMDPLTLQIVIVLKSLSKKGMFVRPCVVNLYGSNDINEEEYDTFALPEVTAGGRDSPIFNEAHRSASTAFEMYEFSIPTEQATIYSLVVDELREYFHGKIAQYFYQQISEQRLDTALFNPDHFSSKLMSIQLPIRGNNQNGTNQERTLSFGTTLQNNQMIRHWLMTEQEISYHAEQANLWPLAMRANMFIALLERRLQNHRGMVEGLMEAFKVFKCYEQESDEVITSLPLGLLHAINNPNDNTNEYNKTGALLRRFLVTTASISTNTAPTITEDISDLKNIFASDIDNINRIFGEDVLMMTLTSRLYLFLADYYLLGFGEISHVPDILGVVIKLLLVIALTNNSQQLDKTAKDNQMALLEENGNILKLQPVDSPTLLDPIIVCHFFSTFFSLIDVTASFTPPDMDFLQNKLSPLFCENGECAKAVHSSLLIIEHIRRQELTKALSLWKEAIYQPLQSSFDFTAIFLFGIDQRIKAISLLLYELVYATDDAAVTVTDEMLQCLEQLIASRDYSLLIVAKLLPAFMAMVKLEKWSLLENWLHRLFVASEQHAHEVMASHVAVLRHLWYWSEGMLRIMCTGNSEPSLASRGISSHDDALVLRHLLSAMWFFSPGCAASEKSIHGIFEKLHEISSLSQISPSLILTIQSSHFFSCEELLVQLASCIVSLLPQTAASSAGESALITVDDAHSLMQFQLQQFSISFSSFFSTSFGPMRIDSSHSDFTKQFIKVSQTCVALNKMSTHYESMKNSLLQEAVSKVVLFIGTVKNDTTGAFTYSQTFFQSVLDSLSMRTSDSLHIEAQV